MFLAPKPAGSLSSLSLADFTMLNGSELLFLPLDPLQTLAPGRAVDLNRSIILHANLLTVESGAAITARSLFICSAEQQLAFSSPDAPLPHSSMGVPVHGQWAASGGGHAGFGTVGKNGKRKGLFLAVNEAVSCLVAA